MKFLRSCFSFACFSAALGMTVWWCYKYSKDEDYSEVKYRIFESSVDVDNPMLSFCFLRPVDKWMLKSYNNSFSTEDYEEFLMGRKVIDGMEKVNFDHVTINISDFALAETMIFRNGTESSNGWPDFYNGQFEVTYSGFYFDILIKCFGLSLKDKKVKTGTFIFDTKMYPDGIRPKLGNPFQPITYIHLPNQLFLPGNTEKVTWPVRNNNLGLTTSFTITSMDILKGRSKRNEPCTSVAVKYDEQVIKIMLKD